MPMSAKDKKEIMRFEEEQKREWNKIIITHIRKIEQIKKPSVQFPETIKRACEEYLNLCQNDGVKPSVAGLSVALGTNRSTLLQWVRGEISVESADIIQYYFNLLEIFDETALKDYEHLYQIWNCKDSDTMIIQTTKTIHDENQKNLKALEIIKEKKVDCYAFIFYLEKHNEMGHIDYAFDSYNAYEKYNDKPQLTKKEFDLLKKVLL